VRYWTFNDFWAGINLKPIRRFQIFFRERFAELFDEKAREMNKVETEYADCKLKLEAASRRLVDSEYKGDKWIKESDLTELIYAVETRDNFFCLVDFFLKTIPYQANIINFLADQLFNNA